MDTMKPEQQRIAIAQACGWKLIEANLDYEPYWECPKGNMIAVNSGIRFPDYLNDLNAMHEAEKTLDYNQMNRYQNIELSRFVHTETTWICSATAAQRAEAFLRTLNLWTP